MTAPGTALAVRHIPRVVPRPNGRCAVECSCHPDQAIAVGKWASWDGALVLDAEAQHVAAAERHIASLAAEVRRARMLAASWTRGALARKVKEVRP
jgi:hypothetical protein